MENFSKLLRKVIGKILSWSIGYSQTGEDLILAHMLNFKKQGFYIDIGANHPVKFNNTYFFYTMGWRGVCIDPSPIHKFLHKTKRPKDKFLQIGVGKQNSVLDFYVFEDPTLSTFDVKQADQLREMGHKLIQVDKVEVKRLDTILSELDLNHIDILSVDTEGYDLDVLESNDWEKFRPSYIIVETLEYRKDGEGQKLNNTIDPILLRNEYKIVGETYINTIYADAR